jgi:asparagine synthase (glutamine-hydrolysing)
LTLYFRHRYIPAPYAIYQDIYKLEPGCLLTLCHSSAQQMPEQVPRAGCTHKGLTISRYWSLKEQAVAGLSAPQQDNQACLAALEAVLKASIQLQSIADVPLGAGLSGGLDSSPIVALMQLQSSRPVRTFTVGFAEHGYNEAEYAKKVAEHLQTEHTELYLDSRQAMDVIPLLPELYDEPFADSSQIPAFLIARMAREHVTVALSGDGGDELFGGYNRYFWAPGIWQKISWLPYTFRQSMLQTAAGLSNIFSRAQSGAHRVIPENMRVALFNEKMHKLRHRLQSVHNIDDFYYSLVSEWRNPEDLVIDGREPVTLLTDKDNWPEIETVEQRMMYLDAMTFLPDDILCKVDRAAMAVSLETRVPFLDHRVVEAAWRLPLDMKIRNGQGKWALRQILYKYVPKELLERPKQGFAIPLGQWLRGPLRDWAEQLLDTGRLAEQGFLRPEPIQQKWTEHLLGKRNWEHSLWSVLMFQAWLEQQQEHN